MFFTPLLQGAAALLQAPPAAAAGVQTLKVPYTRQPQGPVEIDWSNPITRGLVICTHAGNNFREMVTNKPSTITSATSAPTKEGRALMDSASTFKIDTGVTTNFGGAVTWMVGARLDTFPTNPSRFVEKDNGEIFLVRPTGVFGFERRSTTTLPVDAQVFEASTGQTAPAAYSTYAARVSSFNSNADAAMFVNGLPATLTINTAGTGTLGTTAGPYLLCNRTDNLRSLDGRIYFAYRWNRALTASEIAKISANPWQLFKPTRRLIGFTAVTVTISRPNSDITVANWIGVPDNTNLYANIDEVTPSDTDLIISPGLAGSPTPAVFGISPVQPAGTLTVRVRTRYAGSSGQLRVLLQDSSGTTVGTSSWQVLTTTPTTYNLNVTTTGTAARARLEVQP